MKITEIKVCPTWMTGRNVVVIKVETDAGLYGLGEAGLTSRELAVAGAIEHFKQWLIGKDPLQTGRIWQELYRSQYFEGGRVLSAAIAALDIALYDIKGKALNVPVYELLGGKQRDEVPTFATAHAAALPDLIELTRDYVAHGWRAIRATWSPPEVDPEEVLGVWEPRENIGRTADRMNALRAAVGPDIVLGLDYHHRLSVAEAASFCQRLAPGALDFLEEPIRSETPDAYAALRRMTPVPFAIGEEFASKWQFLPYIERGLTDHARLDLCNVGGFTEAMKVAGWCEAHYIDVMPHNPLGPICTAATLHFAAAIPNFSWLEVWASPTGQLEHDDAALFPGGPQLRGAAFPVPSGPGLGVDFDEALFAQQRHQYFEMPHLRRRDGSVQNW